MRPIIYPYKVGSKSARALAYALGTKCVYPDRKYKPYPNHRIINWGSGVVPKWEQSIYSYMNRPPFVACAGNKLTTLRVLEHEDVSCVEFTIKYQVAADWLKTGSTVIARHHVRGHSGEGIIVHTPGVGDIPGIAPLYTLYKKKKKEFRVHVMKYPDGYNIFDVQQKRGKIGEESNPYIRSHNNGWVFTREDIDLPGDIPSLACSAVKALGLDFGAVDIIWNKHENKSYVLEVNTAPGLEGTTLIKYVEAITKCIP